MHAEDMLDEDEFLLLYDINKPKNPEFPYWLYPKFDLENYCEDECKAIFRFLKNDIYALVEILQMPEVFVCPNKQKIDSVEAFCTLLARFAYPCRLSELIPIFGRSVPELSIIIAVMIKFMNDTWGHLLQNLNQQWLSAQHLQEFADI